MKPILYMDIDGVLFSRYGYRNWIQLRPNAMGFLLWCTEHFDVRWLTCWHTSDISDWLFTFPCHQDIRAIKYTEWRHLRDKVDAIDLTSDFYWVEDGVGKHAMQKLVAAGRQDRYIAVPFEGEHALEGVRSLLGSVLEERNSIA